MARLFIAVWLPDDVSDALMSLHRKDQRGVRFVAPDNWHVTLRFLGDARVGEVIDALDGIEPAPARAVLGPAVDVINERALVVPVRGLDALAAEVNERICGNGSESPRQRFVGHVTIARVKAHAPMPRALGALFADEFDVTEIALVRSRLDPGGARTRRSTPGWSANSRRPINGSASGDGDLGARRRRQQRGRHPHTQRRRISDRRGGSEWFREPELIALLAAAPGDG